MEISVLKFPVLYSRKLIFQMAKYLKAFLNRVMTATTDKKIGKIVARSCDTPVLMNRANYSLYQVQNTVLYFMSFSPLKGLPGFFFLAASFLFFLLQWKTYLYYILMYVMKTLSLPSLCSSHRCTPNVRESWFLSATRETHSKPARFIGDTLPTFWLRKTMSRYLSTSFLLRLPSGFFLHSPGLFNLPSLC